MSTPSVAQVRESIEFVKAYGRGAAPATPKTSPRFVYFIRSGSGPIKIGSATDPEGRLRSLQAGSAERLVLLATVDGGAVAERELHTRFAPDRLHGEWFAPSPDLLRFVKEVQR